MVYIKTVSTVKITEIAIKETVRDVRTIEFICYLGKDEIVEIILVDISA